MNVIMQAKIEACVKLAIGQTDWARAKDFKIKVLKVTGLTPSGFDSTPQCETAYALFVNGCEPSEILDSVF